MSMLAKISAKNQLTLPKRVVEEVGSPTYFEVEVEDGRIVLAPARVGDGDAVRRKLAKLGITEADVADAVAWARRKDLRIASSLCVVFDTNVAVSALVIQPMTGRA